VAEHAAFPIDCRTQDFIQVLRQAEPGGLDFDFNGMGEEYSGRDLAVRRRKRLSISAIEKYNPSGDCSGAGCN
jgi:NADPH-dependent curcumin reductase CurA